MIDAEVLIFPCPTEDESRPQRRNRSAAARIMVTGLMVLSVGDRQPGELTLDSSRLPQRTGCLILWKLGVGVQWVSRG